MTRFYEQSNRDQNQDIAVSSCTSRCCKTHAYGLLIILVFTIFSFTTNLQCNAKRNAVKLCLSLFFLYSDTMIQVASSFSTEPSLDVVLSSIPARIYEAVSFLKENMDTFTAKVRRLILCHLPQKKTKKTTLRHFQPTCVCLQFNHQGRVDTIRGCREWLL